MTDPLTTDPLATVAKALWWSVLLRGILAIVFGIIAFIAPGAALTGIAIVFGVYALFDGVTGIAHAIAVRHEYSRWGWLLVQGIVSVLAGLVAIIFPGIAGAIGGLFALWTVVIWAIMTGILGIMSAAGASGTAGSTWGIVSGVVTILFGIILAISTFITPDATLLGLIITVAIFAVIYGVVLVVTAIQLRRGVTSALA